MVDRKPERRNLLKGTVDFICDPKKHIVNARPVGPKIDFVTYTHSDDNENIIYAAALNPKGELINVIPLAQPKKPSDL